MNYLQKMTAETKTRYWVNNPTLEEVRQSLANAVHSCTTNPAHCSKILQTDPQYMKQVIRKALTDGVSFADAPEEIYHRACKDLMELFRPHFDATGGKEGFVTVQEDPSREENVDYIVQASLRAHAMAPNHMAKIPVTAHGLETIEQMVKHNIAICATEVFALAQAFRACEVYKKACEKYGNQPPIYVTHITGIMDQYFADVVKKENIPVSPEALALAGTAVALKQYRLFKERGIPCTMLGGGVRHLGHFTHFVGGDVHVTINWSTAMELIEADKPVESAIDRVIPESVVKELVDKLPNFRRAWEEDGLAENEFAEYGPVMLFRTQFMNGWSRLYDEIRIIAQEGK